jgi:hypothetical protein
VRLTIIHGPVAQRPSVGSEQSSSEASNLSPGSSSTSHEVYANTEVYMLADGRFIGFPALRLRLKAVSIFETRLRPSSRPLSLIPGSSSLEAMPLQSFFDVNRRSLAFRCEQPTRVPTLFATSLKRSHSTQCVH